MRLLVRIPLVVLAAGLLTYLAACGSEPAQSPKTIAAAKAPTLRVTSRRVPREPNWNPPGPRTPARVLSLPSIGIMTWQCDDSRDRPRFAVALAVPANSDTVTGTVSADGSRRAKFQVDADEEVTTGLEPARQQAWTLSSRHKLVTLTVRLSLRFEHYPATGDCAITDLQLRQNANTYSVP